jgi:hypothetical protein
VSDLAPVVLFAVAGFLIGGVYTTWKTAKGFAIVLAVLCVMAAGGGVAWLAS